MENVEKSVEGVCASTISGQGALQLSPELHHHYLCLGNSLGRTGAISFCRYAAPIKVIELSYACRRLCGRATKCVQLKPAQGR